MADHIDTAQAHAERMTTQAITHHMAAQQRQTMTVGTAECVDCGTAIPASRRSALPYATRCIDCQTIVERRGQHGRKG